MTTSGHDDCPMPAMRPFCEEFAQHPAIAPAPAESPRLTVLDHLYDIAARLHVYSGRVDDPAVSRRIRLHGDMLYSICEDLRSTHAFP